MNTKNNIITNYTLNNLLLKQVTITQEWLNELLAIKGTSFELPFTNQTVFAYQALVRKPNTRGLRTGIYLLILKVVVFTLVLAIIFLKD